MFIGMQRASWLVRDRLAAGGIAVLITLAAAVLLLVSPVSPAGAQEVQVLDLPGISVFGDGIVRAQPDTTTARLGIEITAPAPADALTQTRERAERVITRLKNMGIPEADIQTSGFNVYPVQGPNRDPASVPTITGYRGSASVAVIISDVSQVSALLTAAFDAGANSIQGLTFGIRDDASLRRQALDTAIAAARPKAEVAAAAAGLELGGVRSIVEQAYGPPIGLGGIGLGGGGGEGVAPGELSVSVRVLVTYNIAG